MVECLPSKQIVAGSSPVPRSSENLLSCGRSVLAVITPVFRVALFDSRKTRADDAAYNARATKLPGRFCAAVVALSKEVPASVRSGGPLGE